MRTLLILPLLMALCACATFQDTAGKLLVSTALTVDAAMTGWGKWVRDGHATAGDEAKVRAAYEQYQRAMEMAKNAYIAYAATHDKTAFAPASAALTASATTLTALVTSFTISTPPLK
jgi:hypothetical protein